MWRLQCLFAGLIQQPSLAIPRPPPLNDVFTSVITPILETAMSWNNYLISLLVTIIFNLPMLPRLQFFCLCFLAMVPPFYPEAPLLAFFFSSTLDPMEKALTTLCQHLEIPCHHPFPLSLAILTQKKKNSMGSVLQVLFLLQETGCGWENSAATEIHATADSWPRPSARSSMLPVTSCTWLISSFLHFPQWLSHFLHFL